MSKSIAAKKREAAALRDLLAPPPRQLGDLTAEDLRRCRACGGKLGHTKTCKFAPRNAVTARSKAAGSARSASAPNPRSQNGVMHARDLLVGDHEA